MEKYTTVSPKDPTLIVFGRIVSKQSLLLLLNAIFLKNVDPKIAFKKKTRKMNNGGRPKCCVVQLKLEEKDPTVILYGKII